MKDLIAIDPGAEAGVAVFHKGRLVRAELVVGAVGGDWAWKGPFGFPVVCEIPQVYDGSGIDPQDLVTLAFNAGYLCSGMQPESLQLVHPRGWKGQRPKEVDNQYTLKLLDVQESQVVKDAQVPKGLLHNVVDAIGIGLWATERR